MMSHASHTDSMPGYAPDHPAFTGHFPGRPIVPGVLLLDAVLHALAGTHGDREWRISSVKFSSPVQPGEPLLLTHDRGSRGDIRFALQAGGRTVASGNVQCMPFPCNTP